MIRSSTCRVALIALLTLSFIGSQVLPLCFAQQKNDVVGVLPLSPIYVPVPGYAVGRTLYTTVEWEGQKYQAREGTHVLMQIILDSATDPSIRAKALNRLGRLRSRNTTAQLVALYDNLTEREEKAGVLACLTWSEDPRGFPLFARVLEQEKDNMVRLFAAIAFAQWNIRTGVAEIVHLIECDVTIPDCKIVRDQAANTFRSLNNRKSWGCPEEEIRKSLNQKSDVELQERGKLWLAEIKVWFEANQDRFPDWNPGDPLPAAPKLPPMPAGPEDMLRLSTAFRSPPTTWTVDQEKKVEISWDGKRYTEREGVDLLLKVALEPIRNNDRLRAILRLEHHGSQFRNTERIPQLMKLYERLTDRSEKVALLFCLARSKDKRVLPLLATILDTRKEKYLRLPAAYGLALWNARSGVRELIELVTVKQIDKPARYPGYIGDKAARFLLKLNYWKSWWAPEAALQAACEASTEIHDEVLDSCHAELKKWFAMNEHRFPDWQLGDPLPVDPPIEPKQLSDK